MQTADEPDFETRIEKIKAIIEKLNGNELSLKDGIKLYQEAKEHIASANQILEQAEFELKDIIQ
ncbi:exodeoxyribonuclease VII small subunit [Helicobacter aurati]|uniref:Exodeoxyribonuclease VII small subunit n=2 Tax=Helicobacter aurati TaxID=137778 RepID=A0A3D8J0F2_9HELI|nr:exodeoxyribonuclease VII small subunit [Helicobacter aurati]